MIDLLKSIFQSHHPTWNNCHQLTLILVSTEEQHQILSEVQGWLQGQVPDGVADPAVWALDALPDSSPN